MENDVESTVEVQEAVENQEAPEVQDIPEAQEPAQPKKQNAAWSAIKNFFDLQRIVGVIIIIVLALMATPWVSVTIQKNLNLRFSVSAPSFLKTTATLLNQAEKVGEAALKVEKALTLVEQVALEATAVVEDATATYESEGGEGLIKGVVTGLLTGDIQKQVEDAKANIESAVEDSEEIAALEEANDVVDDLKVAMNFIIGLWFVGIAVLALAAVLLLVKTRGSRVLGIVALSYSTLISVGVIIGTFIGDQAIINLLVECAGAWIAVLFPSVIAATAWPWVTAIISIAGIVALGYLLGTGRKARVEAEGSDAEVQESEETIDCVEIAPAN